MYLHHQENQVPNCESNTQVNIMMIIKTERMAQKENLQVGLMLQLPKDRIFPKRIAAKAFQ